MSGVCLCVFIERQSLAFELMLFKPYTLVLNYVQTKFLGVVVALDQQKIDELCVHYVSQTIL